MAVGLGLQERRCRERETHRSRDERIRRSQAIQCMLLTERKWEESRRHAEQKGSNYARLQDGKETLAHPFFVLTWEELVEACGNPRVRNYFTKAISHADKYAGTVSKEGQ